MVWERLLNRICFVVRDRMEDCKRQTGKESPTRDDIRFVALTEVRPGGTYFTHPNTLDLDDEREYFSRVIIPQIEYKKQQLIASLTRHRVISDAADVACAAQITSISKAPTLVAVPQ